MTLDIDTSRALRTHDQLAQLVRAIVQASPEDESRAVEWKAGYASLVSPEASFALARAILGLANRPVSVSAATFEGVGYVVVGAEPSSLNGQAVPDSAELLNAIRRFTGHGWPLWDARTVSVNSTTVLVVTVEPPRDGDRIATLHRHHQPAKAAMVPEGTIFVRQPGATERASRADIDMLQDRLLAGANDGEAARLAERNYQFRALVADAVAAANRWSQGMQVLTIMSANTRWKQSDWMEYVNTDSGRQMATDMETIKDNSRRLRLLTAEPALLVPLQAANEELENVGAFDGIHRDGPTNDDARAAAYRHINSVARTWAAVERAAIELLAE
ncbi:hypothetical protein [Leifsonia sp. NPDC058230]|uniref:hypothetical protein n=1 Tax=Leifsonia sp. NPDC058230 TaxID=3346391 RepID=UPI0036DF97C7